MTVAANFPGGRRGAAIAFASDLPQTAGLSSSSALVVATFLDLSDVNNRPQRDECRASIGNDDDLCACLGTIENGQTFGQLAGPRGVGTFGGSGDHTALLRHGFTRAVREGVVSLPAGHVFVIAASAFGPGFGGSVWALVPTGDVDQFTADWSAAYGAASPWAAAAARFCQTQAGPAAARAAA